MDTKKQYSLGCRIWINDAHGHFVGAGRVQLLEHIKHTGSIAGGAKEMKMSYRQAWQMVKDMNSSSENVLVEKTLGGKGGGGAIVKDAGDRVIKLFYQLQEEVKNFSKQLNKKINL